MHGWLGECAIYCSGINHLTDLRGPWNHHQSLCLSAYQPFTINRDYPEKGQELALLLSSDLLGSSQAITFQESIKCFNGQLKFLISEKLNR
jgi:hypothetical protein